MAKYDPLRNYLVDQSSKGIKQVSLTFQQIENIIGDEMELSARKYFTSWDNRGGAGCVRQNSWLVAGWRTVMVDMENERVKLLHI